MKVDFKAIFPSWFAAVLVFLLADSAAEYVLVLFSGISVTKTFEQLGSAAIDTRFHMINLSLFACEMFLVSFFYALIRPSFISLTRPAFLTSAVFFCFSALFLGQMINLGIYPLKTGIVFLITSAFAFPVSVFAGAFTYDRNAIKDKKKEMI